MTPSLAVVGHPNKGKSSIVATLAEDSSIAISDTPGTTVASRAFPMTIDGKELYRLIDTPGFQRPRQVLAWLQSHSDSADDRAAAVRSFLDAHRDDPKFRDECELLSPLMDGAGILYVVDGSTPYGTEYEAEMEILRWTGRPRMALINLIGEGDFVDEWRRALDQFFAIVRVFDAVRADAEKRFALLTSFGELNEAWQTDLATAVDTLRAERDNRKRRAAAEITNVIADALTKQMKARIGDNEEAAPVIEQLEKRLRAQLVDREQTAWRTIESLYRYERLARQDNDSAALNLDLFSEQTEDLFGLSKTQLIATGTVGGAVAGGGIDLVTGGASMLLGAGIGAVVGGASAFFGQDRIGKLKVLGQSLMSRNITVGPVKDPGLPWVLLGRALLHHRLVSERNHARREAIVIEAEGSHHLAGSIEAKVRSNLAKQFARLPTDDTARAGATELIKSLL